MFKGHCAPLQLNGRSSPAGLDGAVGSVARRPELDLWGRGDFSARGKGSPDGGIWHFAAVHQNRLSLTNCGVARVLRVLSQIVLTQ